MTTWQEDFFFELFYKFNQFEISPIFQVFQVQLLASLLSFFIEKCFRLKFVFIDLINNALAYIKLLSLLLLFHKKHLH